MSDIAVRIGCQLRVCVSDLPDGALEAVESALTYRNVEYDRRAGAGVPVGSLTPTFSTCYVDSDTDELVVERGALRTLEGMLGDCVVDYVDESRYADVKWPAYKGDIRGYQLEAARAALAGRQGVVVGGCGSGKTEIILYAAWLSGQRTLVVVDTVDLQRQWAERFAARFSSSPGDVGLVGGGGDGSIGRILTIATVQSLRSRQDVLNAFGCVVADEVHLWAARTFRDAVAGAPAAYRLGATATLQRSDGLVKIITDTFGDVLYEVTEAQLVAANVRQNVEVVFVPTDFKCDMSRRFVPGRGWVGTPWDKVNAAMAADADRHSVVLGTCLRAIGEGPTLILSVSRPYAVRIAHELHALTGARIHTLFGGASRACDCLECGYVPPTEGEVVRAPPSKGSKAKAKIVRPSRCERCGARLPSQRGHNEAVISGLRDGTFRGAVATSVADKGLDVPVLARAVVVLPTSGGRGQAVSARLQQQRGRLSRVTEGKDDARLYYISDVRMSFARDREREMRRAFGMPLDGRRKRR